MQDADLAGNAFWVRKTDRLVRLRPDWVTFIHGSLHRSAARYVGPGRRAARLRVPRPAASATALRSSTCVEQVAHFTPTLDPIAPHRGMSWLTPLVREVTADSTMTTFKQAYLTNGATPNLVVTGVPSASAAAFKEWVDAFEIKHKGAQNAYKSLYLSPTMDAKVIGSDMAQVDFKAVQGLGETRIAAAAGVPAAVVGISEGLAGSSLNAGNFASSMRRFADLTMRPLWRNACGSFEQIVKVPGDAELWYDDRDVAALKDDIKDRAEVQSLESSAIRQLVDGGFTPESVVDAVVAGDFKRLSHTNLYSVQLQAPLPEGPAPAPEPMPDTAATDAVQAGRDMALGALTIARAAVDRPQPEPPTFNFHVTNPEHRTDITVAAADPAPIEIRNEVTVEPTPVEIRNEVNVEPTPVTVEAGDVTVNVPEQRSTTKRIVREGGQITSIIEEPTDG